MRKICIAFFLVKFNYFNIHPVTFGKIITARFDQIHQQKALQC